MMMLWCNNKKKELKKIEQKVCLLFHSKKMIHFSLGKKHPKWSIYIFEEYQYINSIVSILENIPKQTHWMSIESSKKANTISDLE